MPAPVTDLTPLLDGLGIVDWDAIIVGDGSATRWNSKIGCAWAATLVDSATNRQKYFFGGLSEGTNHTAELAAYLGPLLWYSQDLGKQHLKAKMRTPGVPACNVVHIITDSEHLAKQGNMEQRRNANRVLWAAMDAFVAEGYALVWHWIGRSRLALNRWADQQSRIMRLALIEVAKAVHAADRAATRGRVVLGVGDNSVCVTPAEGSQLDAGGCSGQPPPVRVVPEGDGT